MGILFALGALFAWGFGDFFIQRTSRLIGIWQALFFIGISGFLGLLPFVYKDLPSLSLGSGFMLAGFVLLVVIFALIDFEAMREGKLAVVQPIISLELVWTIIFALVIAQEQISAGQAIFIVMVMIGIWMTVTIRRPRWFVFRRRIEKGVAIAFVSAFGMGFINFQVGRFSREIDPLTVIWATHSGAAIVSGIYLLATGKFLRLYHDFKKYPWPIIGESFFDNISWISFAYATTYIPITIATAIGESYIALSVLLGIFVNREKLQGHQYFGIALAVAGVIALSLYV
jgi:drug/metabolite transporter (DMT)-like permease